MGNASCVSSAPRLDVSHNPAQSAPKQAARACATASCANGSAKNASSRQRRSHPPPSPVVSAAARAPALL